MRPRILIRLATLQEENWDKQKIGAPAKSAPTLGFVLGVKPQKNNFTASCATRGSPPWPARNVPNALLLLSLSNALIWSVPLTVPVLMLSGAKFGGFRTLKYSARSCSFQRSVKLKYLESCRSQSDVRGKRRAFLPTLPNVGSAQVGEKVAHPVLRAAVVSNAATLSQLLHFAATPAHPA